MDSAVERSDGNAILSRLRAPAPILLLQVIVVVLLALRAVIVFGTEPFFEEAYYWLWGQHPALSYVDHPPLNAWLLGLSSLVFGWNLFALRIVGWLSLAATAWLFLLFARRLAGEEWRRWFWTALAIYLASPVFSLFTSIVFPDHLLVPLCLGATYAASRFLESWQANAPRYRYLWLAAILLGLAGLTKYNAVLLALAMFAYLVVAGPRPLFGNWRLYAAVGLLAAIVSPVFAWNVQHGFPTLQFHLVDRQSGVDGIDTGTLRAFAVLALLTVSPLLFGPIFRLLFSRWRGGFAGAAHGLAVAAFVVSTASFTVASLFTVIFPHWNIVAYVAVFAFLPAYVRAGWHLVAHAVYGAAVAALFAANYTLMPIEAIPGNAHGASVSSYGWTEIAEAMQEAQSEHAPGFIGTNGISSAAQLGFAMQRLDVFPLVGPSNQYRFWFDPDSYLGDDAVIFAGPRMDPEAEARFDGMTRLDVVTITRFGKTIATYGIWLGTGFRG